MDILSEKKGEDVLLLDLRGLTTLTDYFVICSGTSDRQLGALVAAVREVMKKDHGVLPLHIEGEPPSGWVLMDYGSVVVHVFAPELRAFYDLEGLWHQARVVVRIQ